MERFLAALTPSVRAEVQSVLDGDELGAQRLEAVVSRYIDDEGLWPEDPFTADYLARTFLHRHADVSSVYGGAGIAGATAAALAGGALSLAAGKGAVVLSSKLMRRYWQDVLAYSTGMHPLFVRGVKQVFDRITEGTRWEQLAKDLTSGAAPDHVGILFGDRLEDMLAKDLLGIFARQTWRGTRSALSHFGGRTGDVAEVNPWIENYVRTFASNQRLLTERTVRTLVNQSLERGMSERVLGERLKQLWPLSPQHAQAVERYRANLLRQDRTPRSANELAKRYANRLIERRIRTMTTTEMHTAFNLGREAEWLQAIQSGEMPAGTLKMWVTAQDELTCKVCRPMDGVTAPIGQPFDELGIMVPGAHPNCRCIIIPVEGVADFSQHTLVFPSKQELAKREVRVKEHLRDGSVVEEHTRRIKEGKGDDDGLSSAVKMALASIGVGAATVLGARYLRNPNMLREAARFAKSGTRPTGAKPLTSVQASAMFDRFRFNGFSTQVNEVFTAGNSWTVQGTVKYRGQYAGVFHRQVSKDGARVHHSMFDLEPQFRGKGFATAFNKHVFMRYKELGIKRVELLANMEVGGYAWARQGFRPRDKETVGYLWMDVFKGSGEMAPKIARWSPADQDRLRRLVTSVEREYEALSRLPRPKVPTTSLVNERSRLLETIGSKASWDEIMGFSRQAQKDLLLGRSWSGALDLRTWVAKKLIRVEEYEREDGTKVEAHFRHLRGSRDEDLSKLKEGAYDMPMSWLREHIRGSGIRIGQKNRIKGLANSILEDGFTKPITVWVYEDGPFVRDGMHRLEAAHLLGLKRIPVAIHHVDGTRPKTDLRGRYHGWRIRRQGELPMRDTPFRSVKQEDGFVRWFNERMARRGEQVAENPDSPPKKKLQLLTKAIELPVVYELAKHDGPGTHQTGTPQEVHGQRMTAPDSQGFDLRDSFPSPMVAGGVLVGTAAALVTRGKVRSMGQLTREMRKLNTQAAAPLTKLRSGEVTQVPVRAMDVMTEGTGFRLGNSNHIRKIANAMMTRGYDQSQPIRMAVYNDGAQVLDGMHRAQAARLAGIQSVPVQVVRVNKPMPAANTFRQHFDDYRRATTRQTQLNSALPSPSRPYTTREAYAWENWFNARMEAGGIRATESFMAGAR
jgi:GNAT superfamily N-acetyltransferase